MKQESSPPASPKSKAPSQRSYWSLFSQGPEDQFGNPQREGKISQKIPSDDANTEESGQDVVNELTSLLMVSPPRSHNTRVALRMPYPHGSKNSPCRPIRKKWSQTPLGSSGQKRSKPQKPLLLQSMRHWDVALPPIKKHVVDGKLIDTFRGSLYGNDHERNLPVAKRKLTIELFGHDHDTKLWGNRWRRNFSDLERNRGYSCTTNVGSCRSCRGKDDSSWPLFKGASTDDLSIANDDSQSDISSITNEGNTKERKTYELAETDVVILRVMKSRMVTPYDDDFDLGHSSINAALNDRKWESLSMSDKTMSLMVGSEAKEDGLSNDTASFSSGDSLRKTQVQWTEMSRTRLSHIELVREDFEANEVDLKMGVGARTVVQTFRFDDLNHYGTATNIHEGNACTFARLFKLLKWLEKERAQRLAAAHRILLSEHDSFNQKEASDSDPEKTSRQGSDSHGNSQKSDSDNLLEDCEAEEKDADEIVSILIEIVSASNLPSPEVRSSNGHGGLNPHYIEGVRGGNLDPKVPPSSDPYVVIRDGKTNIHTTSSIVNTVNPVWTLSTGSLCVLQSNLAEFFERSNVLEFIIKSKQSVVGGEDQTLGTVMIHKTELLKGIGERKSFQILRPPTSSCLSQMAYRSNMVYKAASDNDKSSRLYLRYRQAAIGDIEFMQTFQEEMMQSTDLHVKDGIYATEAFLPLQLHGFPSPQQSIERRKGEDQKTTQYRVKPMPDPDNISETEWMTETQIEKVSKEHSTSWTMAGSGSIGKLYIEIIGCDDLRKPDDHPHIQPNRAPGDKCNPFVNIVFEDSVVNTDVIHNCLSPRWMPWSQRAFVINMMSPSSQVFIGVYDYDRYQGRDGFFGRAQHALMGRTAINLSNLRPRAVHTLIYKIYTIGKLGRESCGSITLRLRLAFDDERRALLSELDFRDHCNVSTMKESDFICASHSINNSYQKSPSTLTFREDYTKELLAYAELRNHITDGLVIILLWRGNFLVKLNKVDYNLPMHSITAFAWATILAWDLGKIFSFFWFAIGWILLAELEEQRRHPSPWRRPRSYIELLRILVFHKSNFTLFGRPPLRRTIYPNESLEEIERFELRKAAKANASREFLETSNDEQRDKQKPLEKEEYAEKKNATKDSATGEITNKIGPYSVSDQFLLDVQKILFHTCRFLRICSSVFAWRDSYLAFWITTLAFLISFVTFWIPWVMLLQWGFRLFLWPLFGPWMKLADIYYFQPKKNHYAGEEQDSQSEFETIKKLYNRMVGQEEWIAVQNENSLKAKDMERYMFGKYSLRLPIFQEERFLCEPSVSSSSVPYNTNPRPVRITRCIHGQSLKGDMVPYRNVNSISELRDDTTVTT